jgi:hypothetical protein
VTTRGHPTEANAIYGTGPENTQLVSFGFSPLPQRRINFGTHTLQKRELTLVMTSRDGGSNMYADSRPERDRQQVVSQEPPRPVDRDRHDCERRCRAEELEGSSGTEGAKFAGPGARAFRINHGRHAARLRSATEFTDRLSRLDSVMAINQRVATATQVVRDAGNPARELAL